MVKLLVAFEARPARAQDLASALALLAAQSRLEAGCESFQVHRVAGSPGAFVLCESWSDDPSLRAHNAGPAVRRMAGLLPALVEGAPRVTRLEPVA